MVGAVLWYSSRYVGTGYLSSGEVYPWPYSRYRDWKSTIVCSTDVTAQLKHSEKNLNIKLMIYKSMYHKWQLSALKGDMAIISYLDLE